MNWKDKFIISWLNKTADINSVYNQYINNIKQDDPNHDKKKSLLETIFNTTNNSSLSDKNKENCFSFIYSRTKDNLDITETEIGNALHDLETYFFLLYKNENLPKLSTISSLNELKNVVEQHRHLLQKYEKKIAGDISKISEKYKKHKFNDLEGNNYEILIIPQSTNKENIDDLRILAYGNKGYKNGEFDDDNAEGRWCVRQESYARKYLSEGNFYIVYKNGEVFAGLGNQEYNCVNRINKSLNIYEWSILLKPFLEIDRKLIENKLPEEYKKMFFYVKKTQQSGELWFRKNIYDNIPKLLEFCLKENIRYKYKEKQILKYIYKNDLKGIEYVVDIMKKRLPQDEIGNKIENRLIENFYYLPYEMEEEKIFERYMENVNYYKIRDKLKNLEDENSKNAFNACRYAKKIIKGRWPQDCTAGIEAEKNIFEVYDLHVFFEYAKFLNYDEVKHKTQEIEKKSCENYDYAASYAINYIKDRWPQNKTGKKAEENIVKDSMCAYNYALNCIKGRWPQNEAIGIKAEEIIIQNAHCAYLYAKDCIKGRWPQNEAIGQLAEIYISEKEYYAYYYALNCIKGRWPQNETGIEAEKNIARKDVYYAYNYAVNILKDENGLDGGRWPQDCESGKIAEKSISENDYFAYNYALNCIKGRWPQNEKIGIAAEECIFKGKSYWDEYCELFGIGK